MNRKKVVCGTFFEMLTHTRGVRRQRKTCVCMVASSSHNDIGIIPQTPVPDAVILKNLKCSLWGFSLTKARRRTQSFSSAAATAIDELNPIYDNKSPDQNAAKSTCCYDVHIHINLCDTRILPIVCRAPRYSRRCCALHLSLAASAAKNRKH